MHDPLYNQQSTDNLITGSLSAAPTDAETVRLLLVGNSERDVALTREAFRLAAPHVTIDTVARGSEAARMSAEASYDIVVLDQKLPGPEGMEALRELLARHVPVIVVAGLGDQRLAVDALKAGAEDYLVKEDGYLRRLPQAVLGAVARNRLDKENRKLIAQTARQASLLEAVLETDPGAVAVLRGPDFRIELTNPSFRALAPQLDGSSAIGKPVDEVFPDTATSELRKVLGNVYTSGQPFHFKDMALPSPEGGQRYFHVHMLPLDHDSIGSERGVAVIMWETTQEVIARQKAEEMARHAEAQRAWLKAVIDQMPEGVYIASAPEGELLMMNRAAGEIFTQGDDVQRLADVGDPKVYGIYKEDGSEMALEGLPLMRAIQKEETTVGEEQLYIRPNGARSNLLVNAAPLYDNTGKLIAGVVVFQDITHLKEIERMKDEFMSIASHELRTPLTNVKATAQLMARRAEQGEYPQREVTSIKAIVQQSERMTRLINELLDVSRLQTGSFTVHLTHLDLGRLCREVVEQCRLAYPQLTLKLSVGGPVWVNADADRIEQVLSNLLDNAAKYATQGQIDVRLTTHPGEGVARIEVQDDGEGFDPAHSERIFDRFSKLDSINHHSKGMGLGLFISRQIMEAHGGTLTAYSPGAGQGATFTVTMPLAETNG